MNLLALACGAGAGLGAVVVVVAWRLEHWPLPAAGRVAWRPTALAIGCGLAAFVWSGWPVLGLLSAAGAVVLPRVLRGGQRAAAAQRGDAVARWVEMLRDTIAGAAGLEEAVTVTAHHPPPAIRPAVEQLAARLRHQPLAVALRGFAADVADPSAELLVAALVTAATNETRDLGRLLGALADATRARADLRRSIDAGRAQVRSAMRLVLGVTLLFVIALFLFSRDYLAPYATLEGQLWLSVVGMAFFAALALLARLDRLDLPGRPAHGGTGAHP